MRVTVDSPRGRRAGLVVTVIVCLVFCAFGLGAILIGISEWRKGNSTAGIALILFGAVFDVLGTIFLLAAIRGHKAQRAEERKREQIADQPWLWRGDWASGRISSSSKKAMIGTWVFAIFWNVISWPVVFAVPKELAKGNHAILIGLLFPAIGIGLLVWAVRATIRWRKFGESVFEMASVPGVVGGALSGMLRPGSGLRLLQEYKLQLSCLRRVVTGSGKNRTTREHLLWQEEQKVSSDLNGGVPVSFFIPADCCETDIRDASNCVIWRLQATAEVPGVDYAALFEVPVFTVAQTAEQLERTEAARTQHQTEVASYQPPRDSRIYIRPALHGGTEFVFSACRNPGAALMAMAFTLVWTAILCVLIVKKAPMIFPIVWALFDLLLIYAVFHLLFARTRVIVRKGRIEIERGPLGFGGPRILDGGEVQEIRTTIGMTAGTRTYHDIQILCRNGKKTGAGSSIRDKTHAQWLAAEMNRSLSGQPR